MSALGPADSTAEVLYLSDRVGRAGVEGSLAPRRRWWRPCRDSACLELVRLPVAVAAVRGVGAGRAAATGREPRHQAVGSALYFVERVLGHGWVVALEGEDPFAVSAGAAAGPGGVSLPARLGIEQCVLPLRSLAMRTALAAGRGRSTALPAVGPAEPGLYPFWLRYRRSRRGRVRFEVLDAVTGRPAGAALRAALASALIDADGDRV